MILSYSWCLDNRQLQEGRVGGEWAPGGGGGESLASEAGRAPAVPGREGR